MRCATAQTAPRCFADAAAAAARESRAAADARAKGADLAVFFGLRGAINALPKLGGGLERALHGEAARDVRAPRSWWWEVAAGRLAAMEWHRCAGHPPRLFRVGM